MLYSNLPRESFSSDHGDLCQRIHDLVAALPEELAWSLTLVEAWVLTTLPDHEAARVARAVWKRPWREGQPTNDGDRFMLDGRWSDLIEFGRITEWEGSPMPLGSRRWRDLDRRHVVALGSPLLDPGIVGTREERASMLVEHGLVPGLRRMGLDVKRTRRGHAGPRSSSDLVVSVQRGGQMVRVNIEARNRRGEVPAKLEKRDRPIFREATARLVPSIVVAPRVTTGYRRQLSRITDGLGGVVETGVYMAVSDEVIQTLSGWCPWEMALRLPDEVLEAVRAEIEAAADRYLAAGRGPQVPHLEEDRVEDHELLAEIEEYRWRNPGCSQGEAFTILAQRLRAVSERRLHRVWEGSGYRWTDWGSGLLG